MQLLPVFRAEDDATANPDDILIEVVVSLEPLAAGSVGFSSCCRDGVGYWLGSRCFRSASAAWTLFLSSWTSSRDMSICLVRGVGDSMEGRRLGRRAGREMRGGGPVAAFFAGAAAVETMLEVY